MVMLFTTEPICNCEMIPNHATCSLKNPRRSPGALCSNHTKPTMLPFCCLLPFVSTYHCEHRSGYTLRGGERKIFVSSAPFFRDSAGTIWEFRTWFLSGFFQTSTEFSLKWPDKLSQFGHNVQNIRLGNTVSISFNTIARKATERSQQKNDFWTFLLKNL